MKLTLSPSQPEALGVLPGSASADDLQAALNGSHEELRRWHVISLHREDRIEQLKREVNDLLLLAGKPPRYDSVNLASPEPL